MAKTQANPLLEALASVLGQSLAQTLVDPLQKIHDKSPKSFRLKLKGALLLLSELAEFTDKSQTKIDDAAVNAIINVLKQSAVNNKIKL